MNNTGFNRDKNVLITVEVFQTLALTLIEMGKFSTIDDRAAQSLFRQNLECSKRIQNTMQVIQKFPLLDTRDQSIYVEGSFTPLSAGVEMGEMCVCGIVDQSFMPCTANIKIIVSYAPFENVNGLEFLDTVFHQGETKHIFCET